MRYALAATFLCLANTYASGAMAADPVQLVVHSAKAGKVYGEVLLEVKNTTDRQIKRVAFNCGLFSKSGALTGADDSVVRNIPTKESDYQRLLIGIDSSPIREVESAKCRVTSVD